MLNIELILLTIILFYFNKKRREISGQKNGAFYGKGNKKIKNKKLLDWIANLHRLETPAWYFQFTPLFFTYFSLIRVFVYINHNILHYDWNLLIQFIIASIATMGTSGAAYKIYQKYINIGANVKDDPHYSENIFKIFGKEYYWVHNRTWEKWGDNVLTIIGYSSVILSIILTYIIYF